ncbi:hypothetical protein L484_017566 [Morus notabilis]|uniref:S-adenosyl-L-methionine-dependent methyltransferase n=1 Tax=Morus notabilis TaxID=981085 RepID=W9RN70_9ROSA|nr:uncharacterized protein LOC21400557 [Morus notabilis]EXB62179.1 hypothetical protein L484_017566 [Morus notabilis]
MEWSATSATRAYLDTIKLCNDHKRRCKYSWKTPEPGSNEFVSALAAGMKAKLIVEVASTASPSTIALAAAARQTGGRLVCILPEPVLSESKKVIKDSGLRDLVEFKTGDPSKLLPRYENIDFSLIDCKNEDYTRLLSLIDVNPRRSVVVANNLVGESTGLEGHVRGMLEERVAVRSVKHPIGKGMEVTMIGTNDLDVEKRDWGGGGSSASASCRVRKSGGSMKRAVDKSKWVVQFDEESGEEHIFRVPK